jgi:hypothetical protein
MGRAGTQDGDNARARLYDVMSSEGTVEERLEQALEIGTEYFGVEYGYITDIDQTAGSREIIVSTDSPDGAMPPGLELDLTTTYCRRTIEQEDGIALHNVPSRAGRRIERSKPTG